MSKTVKKVSKKVGKGSRAVKLIKKVKNKPLPSLIEPLDMQDSLTEIHRSANKKRMLAALEKHMNVVLYACKETGIARRTHYNWMNEDPDYRAAVEDINQGCGDFLERKMLEAVEEKQPAVMIFMAKTKWKSRGYQERIELSNAEGQDFRIAGKMTIDQTKQELPPEAIQKIVSGLIVESAKAQAALARLQES